MISDYSSVKKLLEERPERLSIEKEAIELAKSYREFAGSWVFRGVRKNKIYFPSGPRLKLFRHLEFLKA